MIFNRKFKFSRLNYTPNTYSAPYIYLMDKKMFFDEWVYGKIIPFSYNNKLINFDTILTFNHNQFSTIVESLKFKYITNDFTILDRVDEDFIFKNETLICNGFIKSVNMIDKIKDYAVIEVLIDVTPLINRYT